MHETSRPTQTQIQNNINSPSLLEKLYRSDKPTFKSEFNAIYPQIQHNPIAQAWHERLHYDDSRMPWGITKDWIIIILASLLAGLIAKIPQLFSIDATVFYTHNSGFIVFPILTAYFMWKNRSSTPKIVLAAITFLTSLAVINILPNTTVSNTTILACIHLPLLLWGVLGFIFIGNDHSDLRARLSFLRYTADLVVIVPIILMSGIILTGITLGLFGLIHLDIRTFYFNYIAIFGLAAAPVVGTFIVRENPTLVSKVAPVIARIFSPLVLIMLVIYLIALPFSTQSIYTDRHFLLMFNLLLIGVMALILFSVVGTQNQFKSKLELKSLFLLAVTTIIVNGVALSAIIVRLSDGFTPNRLAILGGNVLILIHLIWVAGKLWGAIRKDGDTVTVEHAIARFLPVYIVWVAFVVFVFPVVFWFR